MSIDLVINLYQGMHFEGELRMLNRLAAGIDTGVIVAIGSYRGQTDCALALHAHVPVYAIDNRAGSIGEEFPFNDEDRTIWMQNVLSLGLGAKIRPINLPSEDVADVWKQPIGMLFIDGSHDYLSVIGDIDGFLPAVVQDGLVAFHDANSEGVMKAIARVEDRLELIEEANITQVYRVKTGPIKLFGEAHGIRHEEISEAEPVDLSSYVSAVGQPVHPSQRPKTPAKKTVKRQ